MAVETPASAPSRSWTVVAVVALVLFVDYFLYGAVIPLTPLSPAGARTEEQLGMLYGAYAVSVLLVTPFFGYLGDRVGTRVMMISGVGLAGAATVLFALADTFHLLLAARLCQGAGSAAVWTSGLALVAASYPRRRVEMIGYAFAGSTAGAVLGPLLAGLMYRAGGYPLPFLAIGALVAVEACVLIAVLPRGHDDRHARAVDFARLLRSRSLWVAAFAVTLAAFAWGILEPLLPMQLDRYGASAETIGLIFTVAAVFYGLAAPFVGWASNRVPIRKVIVLGTLATALTLPGISASGNIVVIAVALCVVNIAFAFMMNPAAAELANATEACGMSCYSTAYAVYNVAYSAGMLAMSAIEIAAARALGFHGALLGVSGVLVVSTAILVFGSASPRRNA